jgi:beta-glucosidase
MEKYKDPSLTVSERVDDLLSRMTITEKVGQLNQRLYGFKIYKRCEDDFELTDEFKAEVEKYNGLGVLYGLYRADPWSNKDFSNGIEARLAVKAYNLVQKHVIEQSRLGIPMLMSSECPHGHQALEGYLLPVNLAMGATFNPSLVKSAYEVCGSQLKTMGVDFALISVLDVLRDPRWGRSEECFSEDPVLCASLGKAVIEGCQSQGVYVVAKHFCAQGEGTGGINASAARIGERELREIHLLPAKECCKAGVKGIMAAYNEVDGIYCHANKKLLTDILRNEMGFRGVVMADGVAIDCLNTITGDNVLSGAVALKAGVNISLWDNGFAKLDQALERDLITMNDLDQGVKEVLKIKFERGLFEKPYLEEQCKTYTYANYDQSLELARQSIVLLENKDNILPLNRNKIKSIAVIGPNADNLYNQLGDYTPPVKKAEGFTVLDGIKDLAEQNVQIKYAKGCDLFSGSMDEIEEAVKIAKSCDLTILVLGGSSSRFTGANFDSNGAAIVDVNTTMDCGEGVDCGSLELSGMQNVLAEAIFSTKKPIISILIQGRPYAISNLAENSDALLSCFYPGMMGGKAIGELLFGKIAPSGRLPVSIPRHVGQLPVYYNYKASYNGMNYYDLENKPLYTFGYGLTYTKFKYSEINLSNKMLSLEKIQKEGISIHLTIKNIGKYDAYAVPQLYIRDLQSSTVRRVKELKAFHKIMILTNQTKEVTIDITAEDLSVWDYEMKFCVEPGDIRLYLWDLGEEIWSEVVTITNS